MNKKINIAIDGVAGSGKGTTARELANRLQLKYLDTGAMYRSVGYVLRKLDRNPEDFVPTWTDDLELSIDQDGNVLYEGKALGPELRTSEMSLYASVCAAIPQVREYLQKLQREAISSGGWIAEGRDIGYAVMPDADVKFFMTASPEERAKRRQKDYESKGISKTFEEVVKMIEERDYRDMHRSHTPLRQLPDAHVIDTTHLSIDEQVDQMIEIIETTVGK